MAVHGPVASSSRRPGVEGSTAGGRIPRKSIACGVAREAVASQGACWTVRPQHASLWGTRGKGGGGERDSRGESPLRWNVKLEETLAAAALKRATDQVRPRGGNTLIVMLSFQKW